MEIDNELLFNLIEFRLVNCGCEEETGEKCDTCTQAEKINKKSATNPHGCGIGFDTVIEALKEKNGEDDV